MVLCPYGHENPDHYQFCGECGAQLAAAKSRPPLSSQIGATRAQQWALSSNNAKALMIFGVVVLIAVVIVVIMAATHSTQSSPTDTTSPSITGYQLQAQLQDQVPGLLSRQYPGASINPGTIQCATNAEYHDGDVTRCTAQVRNYAGSLVNFVLEVTIHHVGNDWNNDVLIKPAS